MEATQAVSVFTYDELFNMMTSLLYYCQQEDVPDTDEMRHVAAWANQFADHIQKEAIPARQGNAGYLMREADAIIKLADRLDASDEDEFDDCCFDDEDFDEPIIYDDEFWDE